MSHVRARFVAMLYTVLKRSPPLHMQHHPSNAENQPSRSSLQPGIGREEGADSITRHRLSPNGMKRLWKKRCGARKGVLSHGVPFFCSFLFACRTRTVFLVFDYIFYYFVFTVF